MVCTVKIPVVMFDRGNEEFPYWLTGFSTRINASCFVFTSFLAFSGVVPLYFFHNFADYDENAVIYSRFGAGHVDELIPSIWVCDF